MPEIILLFFWVADMSSEDSLRLHSSCMHESIRGLRYIQVGLLAH